MCFQRKFRHHGLFSERYNASLGFGYWTSGQQLTKDDDTNSPYVWKLSSGDKVLAFDFKYWRDGEPQPSNNDEFCAAIMVYQNFRWNDNLCAQ